MGAPERDRVSSHAGATLADALWDVRMRKLDRSQYQRGMHMHGACYPGSIITDDAAPLQPIERKPTPFNAVPCCYRVSGAYSARCNRFCGSVSVWAAFPPPFSAAHMADLAPLRRGFSVAGHCATNGAARRWMVGLLCLRRDRQALCNHETQT